VPATLLAVDDSVTMRKVLEMTFAGEDFRVVTADSADAALAMVGAEDPALVLADVTLAGKTGYDLCTAIKRDRPDLPVVLLSSKLHPYDTAKGNAANADDHIDKPFDTQKLIEKVTALLSGDRKPAGAAMQAAPKAAQTPYRAPAHLSGTLMGSGPPQRPQPPKAPPVTAPARPAAPTNLRATADFAARPIGQPATPSPGAVAAKPQPAKPPPATTAAASPPPALKPQAPAAPPAPAAPAAPAPPAAQPVAVAATADMASKLAGMGLTPDQVQGVLALSQEVVERVVWEVVPVLAETLIKEEIKRLTAE